VKEAAAHSEADKSRRELVTLRNKADGLVYSTERTLEEFADNVPAEERSALQEIIGKTRDAMAGNDVGELSGVIDELSSLTYKMTENLYAELGGEDSAPDGG
jgi:molecular chaperone DnaK